MSIPYRFRRKTAQGNFLLATLFLGLVTWVTLNWQLIPQTQAQSASVKARLVKSTKTSDWSPASPDPSGIAIWGGKLLISDGEVDEMSIFSGKNFYEAGKSGSLGRTSATTSYTNEPVGVAVNSSNNHIFVSDDNKKRIFEIAVGSDGLLNTSDDQRTSFSASSYGIKDPEGLAFGEGALFVADGAGSKVHRIDPGANGRFDGGGDDKTSHFDTGKLGERDPEGIEYNSGSLYIVGRGNKKQMVQTSVTGSLQRIIDISALNAKAPAGLASSGGSFYIVDRGVDNNSNPQENDGKLYEVTF